MTTPAKIIAARADLAKATAAWEAAYPQDAADKKAKQKAEHDKEMQRIRSSDGFKAVSDGRD